jgi:thiol-disulfide isomerase/thioredoxin
MKFNKKSFFLGIISGFFLFLIAYIASAVITAKSMDNTELNPPPIPRKVRNFKLSDLEIYSVATGEKLDLKNLDDKILFVNFWATWCQPCIREMPEIEKLKKELKRNDVEFLIISDEKTEKINNFLSKKKINLPLYNFKGTFPKELNSNTLPASYIIKKGEILFQHSGSAKWSDTLVKNFIENI